MLKYAYHVQVCSTPWEAWEMSTDGGWTWNPCLTHPNWAPKTLYRAKYDFDLRESVPGLLYRALQRMLKESGADPRLGCVLQANQAIAKLESDFYWKTLLNDTASNS